MKKILVMFILFSNISTAIANSLETGSDAINMKPSAQCKKDLEEKAEAAETDIPFPGSNSLITCDKLTRGKMKTVYSTGGSRSGFNWDPYIQYNCCEKSPEDRQKCVKETTTKAKSCESIAFILSKYGRDWNDPEQNTPVNTEGGGKAPAAAANGAAAAQNVANASTIKCKSQGIETVDYDACNKFANQLSLIEAVQQVGYATQEVVYKDKIMDSQVKHSSDSNSATGALKATGESLKMQQDMYQQRGVVDATKLAYLYSIYSDMPKASEVIEKCSGLTGEIPGLKVISQDTCKAAARGGGGFALTLNQSQMDAMKSKLIAIATQAGSSMILANLLGKRADDVDSAIAKIDEFKPIDPFVVSEEEATTTFCKQNPGLPQCLSAGLERTFDTVDGNVITFGGDGTGTNYTGGVPLAANAVSTGEGASTDRTAVTPVGSIIAGAAQDNGMEKANAATVKNGGTGSNGGGGGGSGGGSAGGGGGGGPLPTAGSTGGVAAAVAGKTPTYGGGGSFSVVGGFGINKKREGEKTDDNPFGKLFGKDGGKGSGVVNFRGVASTKDKETLFDVITKRYAAVMTEGQRLIEYESTK